MPTDADLVAQARSGSDAAFAAIVRRYRGPLTGFASKLLGGAAHDAEDVVQDAFIRAHASLRASDRELALRPWLYMIVRNRAFDHLRSAQRHATEGEERLALVPDRTADPAERAAAREALAHVVADIAKLPARQRLALVRRELHGASHEELATELGTTVPGVKSLLVRSRRGLAPAAAA